MKNIAVNDVINLFERQKEWSTVERLICVLQKKNVDYYFVGGCVRDAILFLSGMRKDFSVEDMDIVICDNKSYTWLKKILSNCFSDAKITFYPEFLTTKVLFPNFRVDLSFPRKEVYVSYGVLPKVARGDIYSDMFRRDFAINSIAMICDKGRYSFYDPFGGIDDLDKKCVRVLHNKSFYDDPTRILRGIRFCSSLDFHFEKETEKMLKKAVKENIFKFVSQDRLISEYVNLIKKGKNVGLSISLYKKYGILEKINFIKDFINITLQVGKKLEIKNVSSSEKFYIRLMMILDKMISKTNFYNKKLFVKEKLNELNLEKTEKKQIMMAIDYFYYCGKEKEEWFELYSQISGKKPILPLLTGKDLLKVGLKSGPMIGCILKKVYSLQLQNKIKNKEEAMKFVQRYYGV